VARESSRRRSSAPAWAEVGSALEEFERGREEFIGPCELVIAVGTK
jgi:hypothetical protein